MSTRVLPSQGEAFGLRVRDVDFLRRQVHVEQQVEIVAAKVAIGAPTGGRTRTVPLPDTVAAELAEHLRRHPAEADELVFTSREHKPIDRNDFNPYVWKKSLEAAGVEPTRHNGMHALRHFYASVLIDAGESVRAVADYPGHADPGFTLRVYAHLFPSSEDRARQAVDRMLSAAPVYVLEPGKSPHDFRAGPFQRAYRTTSVARVREAEVPIWATDVAIEGRSLPNSGDHFDLVVSTAEDVLPDEYAVAGKAERRRLRDLLRPRFEHVLATFDPPRPFAGGAGTLEPGGS